MVQNQRSINLITQRRTKELRNFSSQMDYQAKTLIILGTLFLFALAADTIGRRTQLPRVTLLLILGFFAGPGGLGVISPHEEKWAPVVTSIALVMVGFLLGGKFSRSWMRRNAKDVLTISLSEVLLTAVVVCLGLLLFGVPLELALLFGGISTATDPVATVDVVKQNKAKGEFTRALLGIVAVDDAWGLILFSFVLMGVHGLNGHGSLIQPLLTGLWELGGAVLVGVSLGIPMALLSGRIRKGEPMLIEALGIVFLCGGIAQFLHVSFLLASIVLGAVVVNMAYHHNRPFHAVEHIELPFLILFLVIAGASLTVDSMSKVGMICVGYIVFRIIGRIIGGWIGGRVSLAKPSLQNWMGLALLSQAGVALGMALAAAQTFPELQEVIIPVVVSTTVLFEIVGPIATRYSLSRVGEVRLY